jgi:hypothetical protein
LRRLDSPHRGPTVGVAGQITGRVVAGHGQAVPAIGGSYCVFRVKAEPLAEGHRPAPAPGGKIPKEQAGSLDPVAGSVQAAQQATARAVLGDLEGEALDRFNQAQVKQAGDRPGDDPPVAGELGCAPGLVDSGTAPVAGLVVPGLSPASSSTAETHSIVSVSQDRSGSNVSVRGSTQRTLWIWPTMFSSCSRVSSLGVFMRDASVVVSVTGQTGLAGPATG